MKVKVLVTHLCPALCYTMDCMHCSLPGFSVHGILQARIPEWVAISFSRGSSWPRDRSWVSCITGRYFTVWALKSYSIPETLLSTLTILLLIHTTLLMVSVLLIIYSWENQHTERWVPLFCLGKETMGGGARIWLLVGLIPDPQLSMTLHSHLSEEGIQVWKRGNG